MNDEQREQIRRTAQRATAHNYGQTVLGITHTAERSATLAMSSWPRADEARIEFERLGYLASHIGDCGLVVTLPPDDKVRHLWDRGQGGVGLCGEAQRPNTQLPHEVTCGECLIRMAERGQHG